MTQSWTAVVSSNLGLAFVGIPVEVTEAKSN